MAQEGVRLLMGLVDSEKGFHKFLDYQFTEDMFRGDEQPLYEFIRDHVGKYGKLPDRKTVKKWAKGEKIPLPVPEEIIEPPEFYHDKLEHRNLKLELLQAMKEAEQHRTEDPETSLAVLSDHVLHLNTHKMRTKLVNVVEDGMGIVNKEFAKAVHGDDKGLMFGWPTLDEMSGGLRGGDLVSIIGRPGMGKTYMALHGMINAWNVNYTTLFVSMEMNSTPVVQRVVSMYTHTSIGELKTGQVSTKKYKDMTMLMDGLSGGQGMWVADGRLSVSVNDLALLCRQLQPDVVYIDGAYMLRSENMRDQRYERINKNTESVKMLAEELGIPIVQTFQFNRGMTKKKDIEDVDLEDIAGSDAIGQLSSLVLGTFQDDNIETKLCRKIRVLKGRSGEQGEFLINWRFGGHGVLQDAMDMDTSDVMNFTEIPTGIDGDMQFM
jgi:replicative DNA helicase